MQKHGLVLVMATSASGDGGLLQGFDSARCMSRARLVVALIRVRFSLARCRARRLLAGLRHGEGVHDAASEGGRRRGRETRR
jgi:hypothetical protein